MKITFDKQYKSKNQFTLIDVHIKEINSGFVNNKYDCELFASPDQTENKSNAFIILSIRI